MRDPFCPVSCVAWCVVVGWFVIADQQMSVPVCVTAQKKPGYDEQDSESTVANPGMSAIVEVALVKPF